MTEQHPDGHLVGLGVPGQPIRDGVVEAQLAFLVELQHQRRDERLGQRCHREGRAGLDDPGLTCRRSSCPMCRSIGCRLADGRQRRPRVPGGSCRQRSSRYCSLAASSASTSAGPAARPGNARASTSSSAPARVTTDRRRSFTAAEHTASLVDSHARALHPRRAAETQTDALYARANVPCYSICPKARESPAESAVQHCGLALEFGLQPLARAIRDRDQDDSADAIDRPRDRRRDATDDHDVLLAAATTRGRSRRLAHQ